MLLSIWALLLPLTTAFYIPAISPNYYHTADPIPLQVNKLTSSKTQLPYAYYDLPFYPKPRNPHRVSLNLGEVLRGDKIMGSDYELRMGEDVDCKWLGDVEISADQARRAEEMVREEYVIEWIVDNLPGATSYITEDRTKKYYGAGFRMGSFVDGRARLNNHVTIVLKWRAAAMDPSKRLIVAFEVYPKSIAGPPGTCPPVLEAPGLPPFELTGDPALITYTYSVYWREDNEGPGWDDRWSMYMLGGVEGASGSGSVVHWVSVVNSCGIVVLLTVMIAMILIRTLKRDISSYNAVPDSESLEAETETETESAGWKLVRGDVFRPPRHPGAFAALIGSGVQIAAASAGVLVLSALGVLNPSYRGGFLGVALLLFVSAGFMSGYVSARIYTAFNGQRVLRNALVTACAVPGIGVLVLGGLNLVVWAEGSSGAVGVVVGTWVCVCVPLVLAGAWVGNRQPAIIQHSPKPKQIAPQPWWTRWWACVLLGGAIPFAVVFVELMYILRTLWVDQTGYYYLYGFLILIALILALTILEISIIYTYLLLSAQNPNWWWRAFVIGASPAIWVFVYSVVWHGRVRGGEWVGGLLFVGYMGVGCGAFGLVGGMGGVLGSWVFVRRIYGAIKAD
ncbi:hypothetical protein SAICODRAFT_56457 [Saitoella complicata NRRL Y-17804]|nr:uncharacterized protein SAICODRAFT_56457 [Saitoella complicata NRRL Y-17804]ODQ53524.1 hypothetical protein SAICODRAFT_56457 [Saitoella complicata NRRL Y-17804]